jgi:hypothetical protein
MYTLEKDLDVVVVIRAIGQTATENSLIGPAFGSLMVNFTPQAGFVRVNATYK